MGQYIVFLTGASGFIGSRFLRVLAERSDVSRIYCLLRHSLPNLPGKCIDLRGSLEEISRFGKELVECDYVFHLGANAAFGDGGAYRSVNTEPTRTLINILANSTRLKNFIFASTIGAIDRMPNDPVYSPLQPASQPNPTSDYGRSKLEAELIIRESGIPATIFRFTWVYGAGMRRTSHINVFVDMARKKNPLMRFRFPGAVSLIHVEDAVRTLITAMTESIVIGRTYFAVTETLSIGKIFAISWVACHGRHPWQIPVYSFRKILSHWHRLLPLGVNNLFIPYLSAEDPDFLSDLRLTSPRRLEDGIREVVNTRASDEDWWAITGANSGIGLQLATVLSSENRRMILIDKDIDRINKGFGTGRHIILKADLATGEGINHATSMLRGKKLRCLVNNAGVGFKCDTEGLPPEQLLLMVNLNCNAPVLLVIGNIQSMIQHGTTIVNVASSVAYNPLPGMAVYAASKSFLAMWSEALGYELRRTNRVVTISPSGTRTGFQRRAGVPDHGGKGLLNPMDVAKEIRRRIDRGSLTSIIGIRGRMLLQFSALLPRSVITRLWGTLFEKHR